jgi:hypothetical protein
MAGSAEQATQTLPEQARSLSVCALALVGYNLSFDAASRSIVPNLASDTGNGDLFVFCHVRAISLQGPKWSRLRAFTTAMLRCWHRKIALEIRLN